MEQWEAKIRLYELISFFDRDGYRRSFKGEPEDIKKRIAYLKRLIGRKSKTGKPLDAAQPPHVTIPA